MKHRLARTGELHFVRILGWDKIILTVDATLVGRETVVTVIEFTTKGSAVGPYKTTRGRLSSLAELCHISVTHKIITLPCPLFYMLGR